MSERHTLTLDQPAAETEIRTTVAPHPMPAPRASKEKRHEPSEAVRASVDRLIDQANRFNQRSQQELPASRRATFQFD